MSIAPDRAHRDSPPHRAIAGVAAGLSLAGTLVVLAILLVINTDIVGREAFNHPLRGATEMVSVGIVAVVFLSLPYTVLAGRMARVDMFSSWLAERRPGLGRALSILFDLTGATLMALMTWSLVPEVRRAWELDDYVGSLGDFTVPIWPLRALQCLGAAVTAVVFLLLAISNLQRCLTSDRAR